MQDTNIDIKRAHLTWDSSIWAVDSEQRTVISKTLSIFNQKSGTNNKYTGNANIYTVNTVQINIHKMTKYKKSAKQFKNNFWKIAAIINSVATEGAYICWYLAFSVY